MLKLLLQTETLTDIIWLLSPGRLKFSHTPRSPCQDQTTPFLSNSNIPYLAEFEIIWIMGKSIFTPCRNQRLTIYHLYHQARQTSGRDSWGQHAVIRSFVFSVVLWRLAGTRLGANLRRHVCVIRRNKRACSLIPAIQVMWEHLSYV